MSGRKTPPLAKAHIASAKAGFGPPKAIAIGVGWATRPALEQLREEGHWTALLPDDAPPHEYDWTWCVGFPVIVCGFPGRLGSVLGALVAQGVRDMEVLMLNASGPILASARPIQANDCPDAVG